MSHPSCPSSASRRKTTVHLHLESPAHSSAQPPSSASPLPHSSAPARLRRLAGAGVCKQNGRDRRRLLAFLVSFGAVIFATLRGRLRRAAGQGSRCRSVPPESRRPPEHVATTSGWSNAANRILIEARSQSRNRSRAIRRVRNQLRKHRIVLRRHLPTFVDTSSSRIPGPPGCSSRVIVQEKEEIHSPDLPRRRGTRSHARADAISSCCERQRLTLGNAICRCTRSSPVTSSVTGCSTCSRVFTSRK